MLLTINLDGGTIHEQHSARVEHPICQTFDEPSGGGFINCSTRQNGDVLEASPWEILMMRVLVIRIGMHTQCTQVSEQVLGLDPGKMIFFEARPSPVQSGPRVARPGALSLRAQAKKDLAKREGLAKRDLVPKPSHPPTQTI